MADRTRCRCDDRNECVVLLTRQHSVCLNEMIKLKCLLLLSISMPRRLKREPYGCTVAVLGVRLFRSDRSVGPTTT